MKTSYRIEITNIESRDDAMTLAKKLLPKSEDEKIKGKVIIYEDSELNNNAVTSIALSGFNIDKMP